MNTAITVYSHDLCDLKRTHVEPDEDGSLQFRSNEHRLYMYATPEQLREVAEHFNRLADNAS